jgi:16S rRNA (guanine527-N7)-methyltransferase
MKLLQEQARQLGISLSPDQLSAFQIYCQVLLEWNARFNLTAITDEEGVRVRHFLDSLSCARAVPDIDLPLRALDVGSGAGFPGLPLKIAFPQIDLTLLEATGKKTRFLETLVHELGLAQVKVIQARAEEAAHQPDHRQGYDLVVARALAPMATLAELTLPFARLGGIVVAQKGENPSDEIDAGKKAIDLLGGQLREVRAVDLPGLETTRHLVVLDKRADTPLKYPRRPGMPAKRPLS